MATKYDLSSPAQTIYFAIDTIRSLKGTHKMKDGCDVVCQMSEPNISEAFIHGLTANDYSGWKLINRQAKCNLIINLV